MKLLVQTMVVAMSFLLFICADAWGGSYRLSTVVQPGTVIDGRMVLGFDNDGPDRISLNDHGEIAFSAFLEGASSGLAVLTNRRVVVEPGDELAGFTFAGVHDEDFVVSINNLGQVAYTVSNLDAGVEPALSAVFVDKQLIAFRGSAVAGMVVPDVDPEVLGFTNAGAVFFNTTDEDQYSATFSPDGAIIRAGDFVAGRPITRAEPVVRPGGLIGSTVAWIDPGQSGGAIVIDGQVLAQTGDLIDGDPIVTLNLIDVRASGDAVYNVSLDGPAIDQAVIDGGRVVVRTGDTVAGHVLDRVAALGVNPQGQVVFSGRFATGSGIFLDDGTVVVQTGDFPMGGLFAVRRINDAVMDSVGNIAFVTEFDDRKQIILAAVPEPSGIALALAACLGVASLAWGHRRRPCGAGG